MANALPSRGALSSAIATWIQQHTQEMADLLAALVALPTENPPGANYRECADLLERTLLAAGLPCERFDSHVATATAPHGALQNAAPCLLATHGAGDRALYFHGHYDVVPAQDSAQFAPRRQRDFLFGRGSCDMKGGLVAMLYAVRALKECAVPLAGRVVLTIVPDEETGGARGSAWLAQNGLLGRDAIGMLTTEPTSGTVWHANRGAITLRVTVLGKAAHVGLHYRGENAFERMHTVVQRLLALKREVETRCTRYQLADSDFADGSDSAAPSPAQNSILLLGGASGGSTNFNVVPEQCWFTIDRRINPEEDLAAEKSRLLGVLEDCRNAAVPLHWEILQEGFSASSAEDDSLGQALASSVQAVLGAPPLFQLCPGLLETRFYAAAGCPAYAYGPGLLSVAHGPNEYVDLRRVADCSVIYALTAAERLCS